MWQALKKLIPQDAPARRDEAGLERAFAALLVHASLIDSHPSAEEASRIEDLLAERFDLSHEELHTLMEQARKHEAEAVDLHRFIRVINGALDNEGRKDMVEMLWATVLADGKLDSFEQHLVWRVAELLGVSTRDRVTSRHKVERQIAAAKAEEEAK